MIDENEVKFLTQASLAAEIERMVVEEGATYFGAIVEFAAEADKSPEELLPLMSQVLLEKVRQSAIKEGYAQPQSLSLETFEDDGS